MCTLQVMKVHTDDHTTAKFGGLKLDPKIERALQTMHFDITSLTCIFWSWWNKMIIFDEIIPPCCTRSQYHEWICLQ